MSNENTLINPSEYFEKVKGKKKSICDEDLLQIYDNCLELLNKYQITGQINGMKKLLFHLECIEKERDIIKLGINTYVERDDVEMYIEKVAKNVVKIIELERYEREIPDEIVEAVAKVKEKFDKFYVVFTDYTGKVEKEVQKERRDKDPILFGTFQNASSRSMVNRFYFIGDWVDEYCDLTLDKMVNEIRKTKGENITRTIKTPQDIAELKAQLNALEQKKGSDSVFIQKEKRPKSFFEKVRTFIKG